MKYIFSIIVLGLGISGIVSGILYPQYINEIFLGMVAPLLVTILSISFIKRTYFILPEKVTETITKSFLVKMILFGLYFVIILSFYAFEPIPFVSSFTGFFILFYIIEAVFLQKLFQTGNDDNK